MTPKLSLILAFVLLAAHASYAQETNHYLNGTSGIKAGTVPPPGRYWLFYNFFYSANRTVDDHGNIATDPNGNPIDFNLDVYGNAHRLLFVTNEKILGADYAWNFVLPFVASDVEIGNFGIRDTSFTFGDLNVEPFVIEWHEQQYDFGFVYGFLAPTGQRSIARPSLPGKNYWTNYAGLAGTLFLDKEKTWAASILSRYEIHNKRRDLDVIAGDTFSFEWGVSKNFEQKLDVGVSGYANWQITDDRGTQAVNPHVRDRIFAVGPEVQYFSVRHKIGFHLRHWWELGARDRPEGRITTFTIVKPY